MAYQPHHMLVTGGAGFIGANFIRHLLTHYPDISVINLDKLTYAGSLEHLKNLPNENHHHFIQGDICDSKLIQHILHHHHIDTIVHFAAESHVDRSITGPTAFIETNVMGTFTLLEAAKQHWFQIENIKPEHCRFHHISTDEVYGSLEPTDLAFTEHSPYLPNSPYAASKASSDHLVRAYHHTYGLPVTISNCSNNYGLYQHPEKFIPTIIRACLDNKAIPIYGNGKNIRDWLHVEDHCRAIMLVLQNGRVGENYNIGGNNEWENLALATYISEQLDTIKPAKNSYKKLLQFVTDRPGHDFRYAIDSTKMQRELGWIAQKSMESGIRETIQHYLISSTILEK